MSIYNLLAGYGGAGLTTYKEIFANVTSTTWQVPDGVSSIIIKAWGSGGGGGKLVLHQDRTAAAAAVVVTFIPQ